ncbi:MAG: hypothetical protein AAFR59_09855, partial [Bacteroidota bacterium]
QEAGTFGALRSIYRFSDVITGVDALVEILEVQNARLISLDLSTTGAAQAFQPQVEMLVQNYRGTAAYIDFKFTFVIGGTSTPIKLGDWTATAIDVDGDDYRLREAVAFSGAMAFTTENESKLNTLVRNLWGSTSYIFLAEDVDHESGISTTATSHMVSMEFEEANTFIYRAGIIDNGGVDGWSDAPDRMFSLNFSPCLVESYDDPMREETELSFPVEWLSFEAQPTAQGVVLNWATSFEENNQMFVVQRSTDGQTYTDVHSLPASGNKIGVSEYTFVDRTAERGTYYYRIMQQDIDGGQSHTQIEEVALTGAQLPTLQTEVTGQMLHLAIQYADSGHIRIVHSSGLEMYRDTVAGIYQEETLDLSRWTAGAYWVILTSPSGNKVHKTFIKR